MIIKDFVQWNAIKVREESRLQLDSNPTPTIQSPERHMGASQEYQFKLSNTFKNYLNSGNQCDITNF